MQDSTAETGYRSCSFCLPYVQFLRTLTEVFGWMRLLHLMVPTHGNPNTSRIYVGAKWTVMPDTVANRT